MTQILLITLVFILGLIAGSVIGCYKLLKAIPTDILQMVAKKLSEKIEAKCESIAEIEKELSDNKMEINKELERLGYKPLTEV